MKVRTEEERHLPSEDIPYSEYSSVTPGYFSAVGGILSMGRDFGKGDNENSPRVIVVNESFARRFRPGENPVGKILHLELNPTVTAEVIGVVRDMKQRIDLPIEPQIFLPYDQEPSPWIHFVIAGSANGKLLAPLLTKRLMTMDSTLPYLDLRPMSEVIRAATADRRYVMFLLSIFACLAVILAMVGIYAVVSYSATRQRHEIGIRMSLGAQRRDIIKMVLRQASKLIFIGTVVGLLLSLGLQRMLEGFLFGIGRTDWTTYVSVVSLIVVVALVASWLPALRAGKLDPLIVLREE